VLFNFNKIALKKIPLKVRLFSNLNLIENALKT